MLRLAPDPRSAGALISAILRSVCRLLEISFAILFFTTGRIAPAARSRGNALLRRVPALGFVAALAIGTVVIPVMERIRLHPESDPGRVLFARYHGISTLFFAIAFLCALFLLVGTALGSGREPAEEVPTIVPSAR
ncbi:MAG TPA: hypothetical protein VKH46_01120 [Thermoanaerobaculia bacterium]|nr:hypothetical protein [Thermoanaerobaculia bacterium]